MLNKNKNEKSIWYTILHIHNLNEDEYLNLVKRITKYIGLVLLASFVVFLIIAYFGGIDKVINIIESANPYFYLLAFLSVLAGYLIRFIKWNYYLKKMDIIIPKGKSLAVYLSMYSMDLTPGKIGRVLVSYTLNRITDNRVIKIIPIVTFDIFTDFLGVAILSLVAAVYFNAYLIEVIIIDFVLMLPYLFLINSKFYRFIRKVIKSDRFIRLFTLYGDEYYSSQSVLNTPKTYLISILVSVPAAFLNGLALYFSLLAIHIKIVPSMFKTVFVSSVTLLFGMITGIPGNLGVTDGSLVALVSTIFFVRTSVASAATIMARFATLWFGVLLGGILLVYTFRYWSKIKAKPEKVEIDDKDEDKDNTDKKVI